MSNFISGTVNAVNTSIKYDDYTFGVQVNGATKLRNAITQGTITISGTLAANISASGGEMIALTSLKAQKGFLAGQAVGFIRAAINRCYQDADGKAVIVFNDNKISDFVCSETYSAVQGVLATSIFGIGGSLADGSVTNAKLANVPTLTIKGKNTVGTGAPLDLTVPQVQTMLADAVVVTSSAGTSAAYSTTEYVTAAVTRTLPTAAAADIGKTITYKAVGASVTIAIGANTIDGASSSIVIPSGDSVTFAVRAGNSVERIANLNASSGGSSLTEYGVAVAGGSGGITARMYGTSLITVTREAADTYRFNIPASGYAQSWELYLPSADNTVAGYTLKFVYASPTFNTNFQTMKPCIIQMMTDTGNVYVNRAAPAATDFANTPTIPTSGTLQHVVTVPSTIQGVVLKIVGKF